jgi:hypothetical protein
MRSRRLRSGELAALLGALGLIVALAALPWYENAQGNLSAWSTFGPAVLLLILAALGGLGLALATITERSTALPVAAAIWSTLFGFLGLVAAFVRVLERPQGSSSLCVGAWVALAGALLVLAGSWQSLRDERTELYPVSDAEARRPPDAGSSSAS